MFTKDECEGVGFVKKVNDILGCTLAVDHGTEVAGLIKRKFRTPFSRDKNCWNFSTLICDWFYILTAFMISDKTLSYRLCVEGENFGFEIERFVLPHHFHLGAVLLGLTLIPDDADPRVQGLVSASGKKSLKTKYKFSNLKF